MSAGVTSALPGGAPQKHASNNVALALAPRITSGLPATIAAANGTVALTLGVAPQVIAGQRVSLLFGDREILAETAARPAASLSFSIPDVAPGRYFVRLRVDDADSTLLADRAAKPPAFDPARSVTVT
jgi:hypothetical protein